MSHKGKMSRGEKWHNMRNIDGNYPEDLLKDSNIMMNIEYFLANSKPKEVVKETKSKGKK